MRLQGGKGQQERSRERAQPWSLAHGVRCSDPIILYFASFFFIPPIDKLSQKVIVLRASARMLHDFPLSMTHNSHS